MLWEEDLYLRRGFGLRHRLVIVRPESHLFSHLFNLPRLRHRRRRVHGGHSRRRAAALPAHRLAALDSLYLQRGAVAGEVVPLVRQH